MIQFYTSDELQSHLTLLIKQGKALGFVPTMGALHEGHLSLIRRARLENDVVVCSIFVNPIQFNNASDLEKYPRTLEADLALLEPAGCDVVFIPSVEDMYPEPVKESFNFGYLDKIMEGKFRPGHFEGVAVVVRRLFEKVKPTRAYFGLKDYQQIAVVKSMMNQINSPVNLVPCEIVREPDGLAMSSRNVRLSAEARDRAPVIFQLLKNGRTRVANHSPAQIVEYVVSQFQLHPDFELEYFEIVDSETLLPLEAFSPDRSAIACIAVWLNKVRLIDNMLYSD